ncbi:unnamed protein product [Medioppia subpectinata]|uniref:non-specific serine/threonine protein kinase n=1 Tax=Medioppia subpectinata TaxID=1979941 RepID=A0A7R9Q6I0_9ACAR|nr:unnamed protein product [Medioppia subpectinata]CAG2114559.1 unnamed protein product [Medioppia subpectinata]
MADKKLEDTISIGDADNYELIRRLGSGRYGEVFEAKHVANNKRYAIKVLKPVRPEKVLREVDVLRRLQSGPNIITLKDVIVNDGTPALVFPFVSNETLKTVAMDLTEQEIPLYLYKLLRAIDFCHKNEVIHRDIKPSNVMIDRTMKTLRLIDWGLADTYTDGRIYPVTVASRFYKPPELLLGFSKYDYSLDMWSFGCVAAGLLFKREPFFNGLDNSDQLKKIVCVLGTDCLKEYVQKYRESGKCSWYGPGFDGKRTACGQIFHQYEMTAAHKTLKCGTKVRVNANGRSVVVTVNDRGPFVAGRILDLSKGAAEKLGIISAGVAACTVTPI